MRTTVLSRRRAGVLLPLASLGPAALGRAGRAFIDWLASAGFSVWQFLPLGPPGPDGSPYWARSDAAGDPALLDPEERPASGTPEQRAFLESAQDWLDDYACFEAVSLREAGRPWWMWPEALRDREPRALARARRADARSIEAIVDGQFAFASEWRRLREHAASRGVLLFGDLPFYVAPNSVETWSHREAFQLDAQGRARAVAGVPPDYFSLLGQRWGNPLYDWDAMRLDGFELWRRRVRRALERADLVRLDHFRALAAHWAIPVDAPDARGGAWKRTPGRVLLRMLSEELDHLGLVAEDLGVITPDVEDLRRAFGLPGMRVLQFGFDGAGDNPHLPHMHERNAVVYTGTHDNDTAVGWYASLDAGTARRVDLYLRMAPGQMPDALVRAALASVAALAVIPAQDLLALGSSARLNTPATTQGNWSWRLPEGSLTRELARNFLELNRAYGRCG